jgi:hypothetical protein
MNTMESVQLYFAPYEAAIDLFQRTVGIGAKATAIRSPCKTLNEFRAAFPLEAAHELRYLGAVVELAEQDSVSVRGTNLGGQDVEYPEPE